jgi:hypothetical protein
MKVAVAVMRKMEVPAGATPAQAAHDFAKALHERWGVGDAACNNGVLLLLAVEDRQVYISTGTGEKSCSCCVDVYKRRGPGVFCMLCPACAASSSLLSSGAPTPTHRPQPPLPAGSKDALTDSRIEDIISDIRPPLRREDYDAAVERAVVDIGLGLAGGEPKGGWVGEWVGGWVGGLLPAGDVPLAGCGSIGGLLGWREAAVWCR